MAKLIENDVANVKSLKDIRESELAELLHPVSFYRVFVVSNLYPIQIN